MRKRRSLIKRTDDLALIKQRNNLSGSARNIRERTRRCACSGGGSLYECICLVAWRACVDECGEETRGGVQSEARVKIPAHCLSIDLEPINDDAHRAQRVVNEPSGIWEEDAFR